MACSIAYKIQQRFALAYMGRKHACDSLRWRSSNSNQKVIHFGSLHRPFIYFFAKERLFITFSGMIHEVSQQSSSFGVFVWAFEVWCTVFWNLWFLPRKLPFIVISTRAIAMATKHIETKSAHFIEQENTTLKIVSNIYPWWTALLSQWISTLCASMINRSNALISSRRGG